MLITNREDHVKLKNRLSDSLQPVFRSFQSAKLHVLDRARQGGFLLYFSLEEKGAESRRSGDPGASAMQIRGVAAKRAYAMRRAFTTLITATMTAMTRSK